MYLFSQVIADDMCSIKQCTLCLRQSIELGFDGIAGNANVAGAFRHRKPASNCSEMVDMENCCQRWMKVKENDLVLALVFGAALLIWIVIRCRKINKTASRIYMDFPMNPRLHSGQMDRTNRHNIELSE